MHFSTSGGVKGRLSDSSLVLLKLCVKSSKPWSISSGAKMFLKCSKKSLAFDVSVCLSSFVLGCLKNSSILLAHV